MSATFFEVESEKPLEFESMAIRSRAQAPPPAATPGPPRGTPRPHGSAQRNGRNAARVSASKWKLAWTRDLEPGFAPSFVLQAGERIALQEPDSWSLLDRDGRVLRREARGPGDLVLDADQGLLYTTDPNGFVAATQLADGEPRFLVAAYFGRGWAREVLAQQGSRLLIESVELPGMAEPRRNPEYGVFEVQDLGSPVQTEEGQVTSARRLVAVMSRSRPLLTAMDGDASVVAVPGHVSRLDARLRVTADHGADFEPLALSVDELGRAHLVVRSGKETRLWVVTREGDRTLDVALAVAPDTIAAPPIVGYDHTVYVVARDRVLAVTANGSQVREYEAGRSIAGAVATADPALVVATGRELVRFDAAGERRLLLALPENLITPPTVAADGAMLAASTAHLFRLVPEKP